MCMEGTINTVMTVSRFPLPLDQESKTEEKSQEEVKMGVSTREKGVLKLVHPGRHVEIHKEPIPASEIMKKYPSHCIARPDVFKYPYIVVRPESVLLPGKVFYLVPNRTLYNLLKAREEHSQPSFQENQPPQINRDRLGQTRQDSAIKCWGGKAPKYQLRDRGHSRRSRNKLHDRSNTYAQDSVGYTSDTSYVDTWTEIAKKIRKLHNRAYPDDLSFDSTRSFGSKEYQYHGQRAISTLAIIKKEYDVTSAHSAVKGDEVNTRTPRDHAQPKSCFRKQNSMRKFLNLKVTFASPVIVPRISGRPLSPKGAV